MNEYLFGLHRGHLTGKADEIAERHGASRINFTEPDGARRGWFAGPSRGSPFDGQLAAAVDADIETEGGVNALLIPAPEE